MATINQATKDLLQVAPPAEWKDFIFSLQTTLIESGHVETLTPEGRSDFAAKMQGLYEYFGAIDKVNG